MFWITKFLSLAALVSSTLAAPAPVPCNCEGNKGTHTSHYSGGAGQASTGKALYFSTNDATANAIIAMPIMENGALGAGVSVRTGGMGAAGVTAMGTAGPDALFSQGAVEVGGEYLFTVNAGSNTLSMFSINKANPTDLKLVGSPQSTLGEFPVSVAYSSALKKACVVNGGKVDGVVCYSVDGQSGLRALDTTPRPLDLSQTTPPLGPPGTASHIFFSPDSSSLHVTVKGNTATNSSSYLASFPVDSTGNIAADGTKSTPAGTAVLFGSAFIDQNTIISTDPSFGAAVLSVSDNGGGDISATSKTLVTIDGQQATCWVAYSAKNRAAYVADAGRGVVSAVDPFAGLVTQQLNLTGFPGLIDSTVAGNYFYSLNPRNGTVAISAVDVSGGKTGLKEVDGAMVSGLEGVGLSAQGLASYEPSA